MQKDERMPTQNSLENRQHLSENRRENTRKHVALSVYREYEMSRTVQKERANLNIKSGL